MCLEDKDEELKEEFHGVINSKYIKYIDVAKRKVDGTCETSYVNGVGNVDQYLGIELCLNKGDEEGLHFARVKKRAVDKDGKPTGKPSNNNILDIRQ